MPRRNRPLPPQLDGRAFAVSEAASAGVGPGRLRGSDLAAPFQGVRVPAPSGELSHLERALAYSRRMARGAFFSHATAAAFHGAPLPFALLRGPVHVSVFEPARAPRGADVAGHRVARTFAAVRSRSDVLVAPPAQTWLQLAAFVSLDDLIVVGDYLVTGTEPYNRRPALTSLDELTGVAATGAGARGIRIARAALSATRYGSLSPQETRLRLLLVRGGLPEPVLNHRVVTGYGYTEAMLDLAYPDLMIGIEYQGDGHRTSTATYRNDIRRRERLVDLGWDVMYVSADDLYRRPSETLERVRLRLTHASSFRKVL